jgi:hypothetical protein
MSQLRPIAPLLLLLLPFSGRMAAASEMPNRHWQQGEILSRKTIPAGHRNSRTRYVYRIKNGLVQYTARFDEPLSMAPYTPLKFSVAHGHLFVQGTEGMEWEASILKKWEPSMRR